MKAFFLLFLATIVSMFCAITSSATILIEDGFESGLAAKWSVSGTNNRRVIVTGNNSPAAGIAHLVFDDSVNDAVYSIAEAILTLDLTNKRNVILTFKAKSIGNEAEAPPAGINFTGVRAYDGVAVSADGGVTWRAVQSLATASSGWTIFSVVLDSSVAALGRSFGADFRIRFSEYDNSPTPIDGIAIDDVLVTGDEDQRIVIDVPTPIGEGTGPYDGYVLLSIAPTAPLTVSLAASLSNQITFPPTVIVPAGQTFAVFQFSALNDSLANLTRAVTLSATASGASPGSATVSIEDDDTPAVTLTLPTQITEGQSIAAPNATLTLDKPATVAATFILTANPAGEVTFQSIQTLAAGQTQVSFYISAVDDTKIDGPVNVSVTTSASGFAPFSATTTTLDNEVRVLTLIVPTTVQEGAIATGTARISGTLPTPLEVTLTSADPGSITVPATVTIPAGSTQTTFTIGTVDNTVRNASKTVGLSAAAATFASAMQSIIVRDNEVAAFVFGGLTDIVNVSSPVAVTVSAADQEGNVINGFAGTVNLSVLLPSGATQTLSPATATLSGSTGWTGTVTLPVVSTAPLRLKATDAAGNSGLSSSFDIMRVLALNSADLLWDAARGRIYASVPAADTSLNANKIVAIDPANLQITGSVLMSQDPGQLAITSGGENLYAALNANGTIGKVTLTNFTLSSAFAVGVSQSYGTLYAEDLCTVAGQPDVVVVSQYRKSVSPRHNGVAAYDKGVIRPVKTQDHTGSNVIEPSADPTIFFGYNTESTEFGFRRLKLDSTGMTQLEVNTAIFSGFYQDIRSQGDKVFSTTGVAADGALMKKLGTFGTSGLVRPDLAANRVYFLEPTYSYSTSYDYIGAYDPTTFSLIRRLSLPAAVSSAGSFIRWGTNGLAFRTATTVVLINSSQLVPSDPQTDLAVTVQGLPNPAATGAPLTYTVNVANLGGNIARSTLLAVTLSDGQTVQNVSASSGTPVTTNLAITVPMGDLAAGASASLTITTLPQSAGSLTCQASVNCNAIDPNFTNNNGFKLVSVGFQSAIDVVNQLRLTANNLVYDATRNLLWASIPSTVSAPLGKSIVSINPQTGLISDPIPINANPFGNSMHLSGNGRYLYVGLTDVAEVHRIDLNSPTFASLRIPLGLNQWGSAGFSEDIETLDGDGTSFMVTTTGDNGASVYDTLVRRPTRSGIYTVDRLERTTIAGTFVGYLTATTGFYTSKLPVTTSGVTIGQSVSNLISGFSTDIRSSANLVLSSTGQLIDSNTLSLKSGLGITGRPCVDSFNQRAYLVNGNALRSFDTNTGAAAGTFALPVTATGDWAQSLTRWGLDGFAILGNDGKIYITRWSAAIPSGFDQNANWLSDAWEATYFGYLGVNSAGDNDVDGLSNGFEYLHGTSPLQNSRNPLQLGTVTSNSVNTIHVIFPRRTGLPAGSYSYEVSADLRAWRAPTSVTETILSTQVVEGVAMETVDATLTGPASTNGFARLRWLHP